MNEEWPIPKSVEVLNLNPGDMLAIAFKHSLSLDMRHRIVEQLLPLKSRLGIEIVVLEDDARLTVVRKQE